MFCSNCGKEIDDKAVICIGCGCKVKKKSGINFFGVLGSIVIPLIGLILGVVNLCKGNTRAGVIYIVIAITSFCINFAILVPIIMSYIHEMRGY